MIINYDAPAVEVVRIFGMQIMCASVEYGPGSSWEEIGREDDDNW